MNEIIDTKSVVVERDMPHTVDKVWRALTQGPLIEAWLMKNNFLPVVGHRFDFRADWGVVDCEVLTVEPNKELSYAWEALGLKSVVTWTLAATGAGTRLRMEQSGFRPDQEQAYRGAQYGWQKFLTELERVVGGLS